MDPSAKLHLLGLGLNLYSIAYLTACFVCVLLGSVLARARSFRPWHVVDNAFLCIGVGFVGGWAYYAFAGFLPNTANVFHAGQASFGAYLPVLFVWSILIWLRPAFRGRRAEAMDILFPGLALFEAIARWGCFASGCCHGKPAFGLPWAVTFDHPDCACLYRGLPVHPTQLYLSLGCAILLVPLLVLFFRRRCVGALGFVWLLGYGALRFGVEFLRGDIRPLVGALTINQWICLGFMALGAAGLAGRFVPRPTSALSVA